MKRLFIKFLIISTVSFQSCSWENNRDNDKAFESIEFGISRSKFEHLRNSLLIEYKYNNVLYCMGTYYFKDIKGKFYRDKLFELTIEGNKYLIPKKRDIKFLYLAEINMPTNDLELDTTQQIQYNELHRLLSIKYGEVKYDVYNTEGDSIRTLLAEWNNNHKNIRLYKRKYFKEQSVDLVISDKNISNEIDQLNEAKHSKEIKPLSDAL